MPSVWESRFAQYIRSVCGLRESTSLELLPDLMPVLPVVDPADAAQWLSRRERPYCMHIAQAAGGAGQYSYISLVNPAGSHKLLVVEKVWGKASLAGLDLGCQILLGGSSSPSSTATRDTRGIAAANPQPSAGWLFARTLGAAPATTHWQWQLQLAPGEVPIAPIILAPNSTMDLYGLTANVGMDLTIWWRERAVDNAELAPSGA